MVSMLNEKGNYMGDSQPRIKEERMDGVELRFDPTGVQGMEGYKPGDKVTLRVEGVVAGAGEDGMAEIQVTHMSADAMAPAAKASRAFGEKRIDTSGTNLGGGSEAEE